MGLGGDVFEMLWRVNSLLHNCLNVLFLAECWGNVPLFRSDQVRVFLTLSPLARSLPGGSVQQRQIELNWNGATEFSASDWIGLYEQDPTIDPTLPLRRISVSRSSGYYKTDVQFGFPPLNQRSPIRDACIGYWIGYVRNGAIIASNCLKIRPSWMWQNRYSTSLIHRIKLS